MDGWARADVSAKIILGVAGLALSVVLAADQVRDRARQAQERRDEDARRIADSIYARQDGLKKEFQFYYQQARAAAKGDPATGSDLDLASALAQTLAARPYGQSFYLDSIVALRARLQPVAPTAAGSVAQAPVALQSAEAAPDAAPVAQSRWFAVIGSYPQTDPGKAQALAQARSVPAAQCAQLWLTKISRNYAVVLGGPGSRAEALVAAQQARAGGIAADAFTQADRGWTQVTGCITG